MANERDYRKEQEQALRINICEERRAFFEHRLSIRDGIDNERRKSILEKLALKQMRAESARESMRNEKRLQREEKLAEWFEAKRGWAEERVSREKELEEHYRSELKRKAAMRQKRVERFRAELPQRIELRKQKARRLKEIVRKYAMRWLNRVRTRLNKRHADDMHNTFQNITRPNALKDLVKYLQEQSGYEKLDDIVMNILKFKEALKRQLLMEEGEEEDDDEDEDADE